MIDGLTHSIPFHFLPFPLGQEAESLRKVGAPLERALPFIAVPKPLLATRRLLVMSFLDGVSISRLEESEAKRRAGSKRRLATRIVTLGLAGRGPKAGAEPPPLNVMGDGLKRRLGLDLVRKMAEAWGWMMFFGEAVHCDNHPGNILLMKGMKLGILDWGQTKRLEPKLKQQLARCVSGIVAVGGGQPTAREPILSFPSSHQHTTPLSNPHAGSSSPWARVSRRPSSASSTGWASSPRRCVGRSVSIGLVG